MLYWVQLMHRGTDVSLTLTEEIIDDPPGTKLRPVDSTKFKRLADWARREWTALEGSTHFERMIKEVDGPTLYGGEFKIAALLSRRLEKEMHHVVEYIDGNGGGELTVLRDPLPEHDASTGVIRCSLGEYEGAAKALIMLPAHEENSVQRRMNRNGHTVDTATCEDCHRPFPVVRIPGEVSQPVVCWRCTRETGDRLFPTIGQAVAFLVADTAVAKRWLRAKLPHAPDRDDMLHAQFRALGVLSLL